MKKCFAILFLLIFSNFNALATTISVGNSKSIVIKNLGKFYVESVDSDGNEVLIYEDIPIEYYFGKDKIANLFIVKFDKSQNVKSFSYYIKEQN